MKQETVTLEPGTQVLFGSVWYTLIEPVANMRPGGWLVIATEAMLGSPRILLTADILRCKLR